MAKTTISRSAGFTIIELMLAVTLGGMLLGFVALVFREPSERAQKRTLQELAIATRHLFLEAQHKRTQYWLIFDLDKNTWRVEEPQIDHIAGTVENKAYTYPRNPEIKALNELPDALAIEDVQTLWETVSIGEARIGFRPSGYVDPFVLHIETTENSRERRSLIVQPLTGFSDIEEGYVGLPIVE